MNMNLNQLAMLQKAKTALERFRANHPKFPAFLDTIQKNAMQDGTIDISCTAIDEQFSHCSIFSSCADSLQ